MTSEKRDFPFPPEAERPAKKAKGAAAVDINAVAYIDLADEGQTCDYDSDQRADRTPNLGIRAETQHAIRNSHPSPDGAYDTCFGMLCMHATSLKEDTIPRCTPAMLRFKGNAIYFDVDNCDGVAVLVSESLSRLVREFPITLTASICGRKRKPRPSADPGLLSVRIIVHGLIEQKDVIADTLTEGALFLQHPGETEFDRSRVEYVNPQYLLGPGQKMPAVEELSVSTCCAPHGQRLAQAQLDENEVNQVQKIFDTATTMAGPMQMIEPSPRLRTELKQHQREALAMMVEKEEGVPENAHFPTMWKSSRGPNGQVRYQNIVTELFEMSTPPPLRGGILADEMGLGKTLSSLSTICHYLDQIDQNPRLGQNTRRTTLIVAPKSTIYGWEKQIRNHIRPERIKWIKYYGLNRESIAREIGSYDVVLTTYDILRLEEARKGPLLTNNWARVVLDEAHHIRNRNSKLFRAVCALPSQRRWCLTGTPIQNCLDDFGALLAFIGVDSLQTRDLFNTYLARPFKERQKDGTELLRNVVAATCLRRTKHYDSSGLRLPQRTEHVEIVRMGPDEREVYEFFKRYFYLMVGGEKDGQTKPYTNTLVLISMLRRICNHGEALLTDVARKAWRERDEKLLTLEMLEANVNHCAVCHNELVEGSAGEPAIEELPCGHVICESCIPSSHSTGGPCPHCDTKEVRLPSSRTQASSQGGPTSSSTRVPPSAKLKALLHKLSRRQDLKASNTQLGKVYEKYPVHSAWQLQRLLTIFSVIFSQWTKMLDLIGNALKDRQLSFQRIDGQSSMARRTEALKKFSNDPQCTIMLASIGAAGEGIDLTSATSVHIVEPHWNPMAEAQAVDRVHRIGQLHDVEVVRYIVEDSIEVYIRWVQDHKLHLIKESLSSSDQKMQVSEVRWKKLLEFLQ